MQRIPALLLAGLSVLPAAVIEAAQTYTEGTDYVLVRPVQPTNVAPGKIEVLEVFSYGCPGCNNFQETLGKLRRSLPADAKLVYLPASFNPAEDWPMFQRAYLAADALGIAERTHQAMYDAVWKTGELGTFDSAHRLLSRQPSLEDAARCYARLTGVTPTQFLAAAKSFTVDLKVRSADAEVMALEVGSTPCIVVNGKYKVTMPWTDPRFVDLVDYLVARESH
jgi:protein dithiol oxidoreductase (disulfide-forming)